MSDRTAPLVATWVQAIDPSGRMCLEEHWVSVGDEGEQSGRAAEQQAA